MAKILIKNGRVWDGFRFSHVDILTANDRIASIQPHICEQADLVFDATGKIVSAGFVDAHVHMRGISSTRFGIQAEMSCFPFGVTAAADASGARGDKALLDSFMLKNVVFVRANFRDNRPDLSETEARMKAFGDRIVGVKTYFDTTVSQVIDTAPLREVCQFARDHGLRVMVHSSHSPTPMAELLAVLDTGDILTHSFHGGEHHAAEDHYEAMRRAQARGVLIDVGFAGHVHTDFAVLKGAIDSGVIPDIISTDITRISAYIRGGRYGMTMCMSIAKTLGMREEDIFTAVTTAPARALGKDGEWGCLNVGGCADITVLAETDEKFDLTDNAGNHVQSDKGYRCVLTVSDGQVVYRY